MSSDESPVSLSLAGSWQLELDPNDLGVSEDWFRRSFSREVKLPGSLDGQGIGELVDLNTKWTGTIFDRSFFDAEKYASYRESSNFKVPFCLQPETRFVGVAWYQKEFEVPQGWNGKALTLFLERVHWQVQAWLDEREIGSGESLSTAVELDLGRLQAGQRYRLTLRVDNRLSIPLGENAHSLSDHTQGNWNGVVGRIELLATEGLRCERLEVFALLESRSIRVEGALQGALQGATLQLAVRARRGTEVQGGAALVVQETAVGEGGVFEGEILLGADALLWDEFGPHLYELELRCGDFRRTEVFGLRRFTVEGTQFCINGSRTFLRGALDCCVFPKTGHPPMDQDSWREILGRIKAHGFNHVRFHSWCPPKAAFEAGDELGLYFQVECAVWPNAEAVLAFNSPAGIGDGEEVDEWVYREGERILRAYGNHPCFVMMACGNEPGGPQHEAFLTKWVKHFRKRDPRRLYTGAAGWPELDANDFQVISEPRVHQWGDGLDCRLNGSPPATTYDYRDCVSKRQVPVIAHENGQWSAYPPLYDTGKYCGHLKARNYEIFGAGLAASGLEEWVSDFVRASGKLQALCYKEEIESALRTPGMAGFQLLGLQDFPGQGTAPVGVLDAFWESKGYLEAAEMRRFCGELVVLARLDKRVYSGAESLEAIVEVAHFGLRDWKEARLSWKLVSQAGAIVDQGEVDVPSLERGGLREVASLACSLSKVVEASRCRLVVELSSGVESVANSWDIWVYSEPIVSLDASGVAVVSNCSDALTALEAGMKVLWYADAAWMGSDVALGFTPIFWNTACTQQQAPHTLGILCDPEHPALKRFPTDCHTDWQWWHALRGATPLNLELLAGQVDPIVRVIDDWYTNRDLGLLWEASLGKGKLLVCGLDLSGAENCLVKRQFLHSLFRYLDSPEFAPKTAVSTEVLWEMSGGKTKESGSLGQSDSC
ncbi:glycoside hydrolase family 2 TIM barrel-domain containing protein [Pelagicoccus enzymogenes]|uniref:sugar-binding domain-containing protein n=1 Tax=Pelagicoccus enzymogenes TaxID=2773457 RepID=UPI00280EA01D|nr:sugar-binding domain-containing protein [Pelagicoccus enzymogenes]MDQ8196792.1 glycoside hydrolase family 2 TIM barrel-domain containing protein [Pelagicoccus enzymogenes]